MLSIRHFPGTQLLRPEARERPALNHLRGFHGGHREDPVGQHRPETAFRGRYY